MKIINTADKGIDPSLRIFLGKLKIDQIHNHNNQTY